MSLKNRPNLKSYIKTGHRVLNDMSDSDFKDITEGVKNIVLAFGLVVGGVWSYYVFDTKLEVENSEALLEKTLRELERTPIVDARLESTYTETESTYLIEVIVTLKNMGNERTLVKLPEKNVIIGRPVIKNSVVAGFDKVVGGSWYQPKLNGGMTLVKAVSLLPQQEQSGLYIFSIKEPGLYQISFRGIPAPNIVNNRPISKIKHVLSAVSTIYLDESKLPKK